MPTTRRPPSGRLIRPSASSPASSRDATIISGTSRRISWAAVAIGRTRAASPRIRPRFAIFEPTTLPTATSARPFSAPCTLTASSGALVPKATTVRPMTSDERPKRRASAAAPLTSHSAPSHSATRPATIWSHSTRHPPGVCSRASRPPLCARYHEARRHSWYRAASRPRRSDHGVADRSAGVDRPRDPHCARDRARNRQHHLHLDPRREVAPAAPGPRPHHRPGAGDGHPGSPARLSRLAQPPDIRAARGLRPCGHRSRPHPARRRPLPARQGDLRDPSPSSRGPRTTISAPRPAPPSPP